MLRDSEEVKTSFFVYFGGDHCTPSCIGKGVIDTGCSRFLIGQNQDNGHTPSWNCWYQGSTCARGAWRRTAFVVNGILEGPWLPH